MRCEHKLHTVCTSVCNYYEDWGCMLDSVDMVKSRDHLSQVLGEDSVIYERDLIDSLIKLIKLSGILDE